ncbi:hypothetical protein HOP54_08900 [Halomonas daqingensis]|uniref:tail fiber protein n=1 Tax=Billgrantia desiderata TaxID=52021 RepID=UPI001F191CC5|nr:tail fiber protein [Halomonas desiderata]MCE8028805.1 hypothetical protein [Halomonas desiderata]
MALKITITDAGRAEVPNADNTGTAPVKITHVALGDAGYTTGPEQTALQSEVKRISSIAGEAVSPDTISVTVKDEGSDTYTVREFGLITEHGTLFAVYSQADPIIEKASPSTLLLTIDVILADIDATSLTFGDISFSNPPASTTVAGVVRLSSSVTSTAQNLAATPNAVKQANDNANTRLAKSANLSDLDNAITARSNLGLGSAATQPDTRYAHRASNLSDLSNAATARANLGLGTAATVNTGTTSGNVPTTSQADARYAQRSQNLSDLDNAITARSNLGLGSAATQPDTRYAHRASNLSDLSNAATARNNLGLGEAATRNVGNAIGQLLEALSVIRLPDCSIRLGDMKSNSYRDMGVERKGSNGSEGRTTLSCDASTGAPQIQMVLNGVDRLLRMNTAGDLLWSGNLLLHEDNTGSAVNKDAGQAIGQVLEVISNIVLSNSSLTVGSATNTTYRDVGAQRMGSNGNFGKAALACDSSDGRPFVLFNHGGDARLLRRETNGHLTWDGRTIWDTGSVAFVNQSTGRISFPGGFKIQWGPATATGATVTFPLAFSSTPYFVAVTPNVASSTSRAGHFSDLTTTGMRTWVDTTSGAGMWLAMGV